MRQSDRHGMWGHLDRVERRVLRGMWCCIGAFAAILLVVVWWVWPEVEERTPRARAFEDFDVCVLVDSGGVRGEPAAAVWAGLGPVAAQARVRLSYLAVTGEQGEERARLFVATQVQQGCDVIVAVGQAQARAATGLAEVYPDVRFVAVESGSDVAGVAGQVRSLL